MHCLLYILLDPMTWLVIGFLFLLVSRKWGSSAIRKMLTGLLVLYFLATTTAWLPRLLVAYLEDKYSPLKVENLDATKRWNIIVLGGGMGYDKRLTANLLLEPIPMIGLGEGIRIHNRLPHSKIITSGYSKIGRTPQAFVAREAAINLGVADSAVIGQGEPSNTMEEASIYVKRFGKDVPLIVVTTATHMHRAIYIFKNAGVKHVSAAPAFYRIKRENPFEIRDYLIPNFNNWEHIKTCMHEIVGFWWAKWKLN